MHGEAGARFELKRESMGNGFVRYALTLELPERRFAGVADLGIEGGTVEFTWEGGAPPDWSQKLVQAQLRLLLRDGATGKAFPRRVTRWRPAPARAPE